MHNVRTTRTQRFASLLIIFAIFDQFCRVEKKTKQQFKRQECV